MNETIQKIIEYGVVAVIRAESKEEGIKIIEAAKKGGIKALEITMTVPGAIDIIKEISEIYKDEDLIIGAGTVFDWARSDLANKLPDGSNALIYKHETVLKSLRLFKWNSCTS